MLRGWIVARRADTDADTDTEEYLILMLRRRIVSRRTRGRSPTSSTVVALVPAALRAQKVLTLHLALRE